MQIMTNGYHDEWQTARINWVLSKYPEKFWNGKKVLELAPHNGTIGNAFQQLGADVLGIEGREENIKNIRERFPDYKVELGNLDSPDWSYGKFDVIINFGILYHLEKFHREFLANCVHNCKVMFLESVVYDSDEPIIWTRDEEGVDQSLTNRAGIPSSTYIQSVLRINNCRYVRYDEESLNGNGHKYDWKDANSKQEPCSNRRMWIVQGVSTERDKLNAFGVNGTIIFNPEKNKYVFRYTSSNGKDTIDLDVLSETLDVTINGDYSVYTDKKVLDYT